MEIFTPTSQILDSAQHRITLVSYAVYQIPYIREALVRAAGRGVEITVIVETPNKLEGQNEYDTLKALGRKVAACAKVYYWPEEERERDQGNNKLGILHVKCVVADGQWLFLSSANLTEYAFTINMELGVLIEGGDLPRGVEQHFEKLIERGVLKSVDQSFLAVARTSCRKTRSSSRGPGIPSPAHAMANWSVRMWSS